MKRTLCIAFLSAILLPCAVISSCGNDDEQQPDTPTPAPVLVPGESVFDMVKDSIAVSFRLENEKGDSTTVFAEGEDIIFDLTIKKIGKEINYVTTNFQDILGNDFFRVYTLDGKDLGMSWRYNEKQEAVLIHYFHPGVTYYFKCSWLGHVPAYQPMKNHPQEPLPAGQYRVVAPTWIGNDTTVPLEIYFTVK